MKTKLTPEEKREKKRIAWHKWSQSNRDRIKSNKAKWEANNPDKIKEYAKRTYTKHREKSLKRMKLYAKKRKTENPDKVRELARIGAKQYRARHPDRAKNASKKCSHNYWLNNKEKLKAKARLRYVQNREKIIASTKKYKESHRQQYNEARQKWKKKRLLSDPSFKIKTCLSHRIREAIREQRGVKAFKSAELLGCTVETLRRHLESLWLPGMSWDNYGFKGWQIDHIRPCASFDLTDPEQQRQCFHWTNLQPLWAKDNLAKSDHYESPATADSTSSASIALTSSGKAK